MLNFQDICSLPISFDLRSEEINFGEELLKDNSEKVSLKSLIPGLLNKSLVYPVDVYIEHKKVRYIEDEDLFSKNFAYDVVVLPEGLLGIEFIKSHIYYSPNGDSHGSVSNIIEIFHGSVTILLQKNHESAELTWETKVKEGIVIHAQKGDKVILPKGYFYTFINTGMTRAIFARVYRKKGNIDYTALNKEQGLAYFCIRKNARCEVVKNPRYRDVPEVTYRKAKDTFESVDVCDTTPIYQQIRKEVNMFTDILWG